MLVAAVVAIFVSNKTYQVIFVTVAIAWQVFWIARLFGVLQ